MNYPQIRFQSSFLLIDAIYNDIESAYMPPQAKTDERNKLSREAINEKLEEFEKAWRPYEERLIKGMCELLNLEFRQNVIDIYAAPFTHSFSFPMFIATKYEPDRAIEVITHELLHCLLYDNSSHKFDFAVQNEKWRQLFSDVDDGIALIHVPVHAVLQALFDDIIGEPERTKRDKEMCGKWPSYNSAWEYVEKHGYKEIIEQIKI
ncbi:MAG: hypothetical protein JWN28_550 [Candidatus Saccharibacteria bacterium]|nr:hypothetical protein [Candidatus Saccharibacteria bacterium]